MPLPPNPGRSDPPPPNQADGIETHDAIATFATLRKGLGDYKQAKDIASKKAACNTAARHVAKQIVQYPEAEKDILDTLKGLIKNQQFSEAEKQATLTDFIRAIADERRTLLSSRGQAVADTRSILDDLLRTLSGEYREDQ